MKPSQHPTPFSTAAYRQHEWLSENIGRRWVPSRLVIRDSQRAITRAEKEMQTLAIVREMSRDSERSLNQLVEHIYRGTL